VPRSRNAAVPGEHQRSDGSSLETPIVGPPVLARGGVIHAAPH